MNIKPVHANFRMPTRGTAESGAYDLYMPHPGRIWCDARYALMVPLGFAAEVPPGHVALILPRSGVGSKHGVALNNTCGVIDSDYRGEWVAALRLHNRDVFNWEAGDRILQMLIVPVITPDLIQVDFLIETNRGTGGFGSTGS